MPVLCY